ncbi:MAG: nitrite reductase, copper-containing [Gemmatimonadetes bacterium]|nr:nitrite reductase, copper-containing [Gemmatimonadota bacterium]
MGGSRECSGRSPEKKPDEGRVAPALRQGPGKLSRSGRHGNVFQKTNQPEERLRLLSYCSGSLSRISTAPRGRNPITRRCDLEDPPVSNSALRVHRWLGATTAVVLALPLATWGWRASRGPAVLQQEEAVLTDPPAVPPPITRTRAARVVVQLETREVLREIAPGVQYTFWTFGGSVPGKFIRIREGDEVEFHLNNHPESRFPHNIDLHAVTGPGGGATSSFTSPGHASVFSFKALNPGLYVYHCATAPVGMHVANGMYGLILVEPEAGLPKVDREYYVVQGEFYTAGPYGQAGTQPFSMEKALREDADYVLFNGSVGSLTGDRALTASVGETVRLFVGNGGPNLLSSFHVIGEIFDRVYAEAGTAVNQNVQTTLVPAGGAAMVEFRVQVPGTYILVDHSLLRAFNKGALGMLRVSGPDVLAVYSGRQSEGIYSPEGAAVQVVPGRAQLARAGTRAERIEFGRRVFEQNCAACHQTTGVGLPPAFPPLAGADYLNADKRRAISVLLRGLQGEVVVNGQTYNGVMPLLRLEDDDVANVLTYVYSQWGNAGHEVTPAEVASVRRQVGNRQPQPDQSHGR